MAAVVAGLLCFTAFPPLEWAAAAWVALVPLLFIVATMTPARAFRFGLIAGLVFWWSSIIWLTRVSWAGWLMLGTYCALYIALFSMAASWVLRAKFCHARLGIAAPYTLFVIFVIPAIWVGLEYLRSTLFTGFSWNPMGITQAGLLPLIQCAAWGGVYAVSFLVVLVNVGLAWGLLQCIPAGNSAEHGSGKPAVFLSWFGTLWPPALCLALLILAWAGGLEAIRRQDGRTGSPLRVALIQLNIPQFEKMVEECFETIELRLQRSTVVAIKKYRPELVIWPETAVPTFVRGVPSTEKLIAELMTHGVPILVGAMDFEQNGDQYLYFNSSLLFDPERGLAQTYAKQHLVCFGEYVPLADVLPWLRRLTPIQESFVPGTVQTLFHLDTSSRAFSVLICFEDTVAALARVAARAGARLLVNQTNDAWFDPSWASRQHMLQCVFRCVENRLPAVRASNTGITCFIDRTGRVTAALPPTPWPEAEPECLAGTVQLPGPKMPLTFYTRYGDLFAKVCLGVTLLLVGFTILKRKKARR